VTFNWDPVLVGQPTVEFDPELAGFFANFNPVPNLFGTHTGADDAAVLTNNVANFSSSAIGARIENLADDSSCEVTAVTATTLTCALAGGADNHWDTGDRDRLRVGSPLAMLEVLLDNLDQVIAVIDNVNGGGLGDALDTKLPVVGVKPRELLSQLQDLRRAMEEIRGTGASVRCGTTDTSPAPTGDPSKLTIANGASATIHCNAYNPKGAATVSWGTPTVLATAGVTAAVTANATDVATAGTAPTANAAITFTNNSGSTVELFQRSQPGRHAGEHHCDPESGDQQGAGGSGPAPPADGPGNRAGKRDIRAACCPGTGGNPALEENRRGIRRPGGIRRRISARP
jgi:hypothetical protein